MSQLDNAVVNPHAVDDLYSEGYEILFEQPLDHKDPSKGSFKQRVILGHINVNRPVVVELQGYNIWNDKKAGELSSLLKANQIIIEHRYHGVSVPDSLEWKYLTIEQAAADQHRIIDAFKKYYSGKWITTGISKGGQTAMFHKRFYPHDADVTVSYVAPLNFLREDDQRIYDFIDSRENGVCKERILEFQRAVLRKKREMLPKLKTYAAKKGFVFERLGSEGVIDFAALEYPFAFWQWGKGLDLCDEIPNSEADPQILFSHLVSVVPLSWYNDKDIRRNIVSHYQFQKQLGYYGYRKEGLEHLLTIKEPDNSMFAPKGADLSFDPKKMKDLQNWLMKNGSNMMYIYGANDTWTATAVDLKNSKTNAVKFLNPGGNHATRIRHFPVKMKKEMVETLENWLQMELPQQSKVKLGLVKKKM
ncbi:MAG: hypothetical protein MI784_07990 [Cytophagales bacterium]|nr:hypothetical protein [Cytophagales bacterium]